MKRSSVILTMSLVLGAFIITLIACNKKAQSVDAPATRIRSTARIDSTVYYSLDISLHRWKGTSKMSHNACNCYQCFGMCMESVVDDGNPEGPITLITAPGTHAQTNATVIMEGLGNNQAKMYFLRAQSIDPDVTVDPTFYVDHNVMLVVAGDTTIIPENGYPYVNVGGSLTINGNTYPYVGTSIVDIQ